MTGTTAGPPVCRVNQRDGQRPLPPAGYSAVAPRAAGSSVRMIPGVSGAAGAFGRISPAEPIVLSTEWNVLVTAPAGLPVNAGLVGMLQADYQPTKGVHVEGTFELKDDPNGVSAGGWLGAWWFFLPHFDVRVDGILQSVAAGGQSTLVTTFLAQAHAYL